MTVRVWLRVQWPYADRSATPAPTPHTWSDAVRHERGPLPGAGGRDPARNFDIILNGFLRGYHLPLPLLLLQRREVYSRIIYLPLPLLLLQRREVYSRIASAYWMLNGLAI